jgi:vacuolar-type H+-ATPase subunit H
MAKEWTPRIRGRFLFGDLEVTAEYVGPLPRSRELFLVTIRGSAGELAIRTPISRIDFDRGRGPADAAEVAIIRLAAPYAFPEMTELDVISEITSVLVEAGIPLNDAQRDAVAFIEAAKQFGRETVEEAHEAAMRHYEHWVRTSSTPTAERIRQARERMKQRLFKQEGE